MDSDLKLKRLYNTLNARYYEGSLPGTTALWWERCADKAAVTFEIDGASYLGIKVDPSVMGFGKYLKLVLNHEMSHVKLWPLGYKLADHGRYFDEEIQRLTKFRSYRNLL